MMCGCHTSRRTLGHASSGQPRQLRRVLLNGNETGNEIKSALWDERSLSDFLHCPASSSQWSNAILGPDRVEAVLPTRLERSDSHMIKPTVRRLLRRSRPVVDTTRVPGQVDSLDTGGRPSKATNGHASWSESQSLDVECSDSETRGMSPTHCLHSQVSLLKVPVNHVFSAQDTGNMSKTMLYRTISTHITIYKELGSCGPRLANRRRSSAPRFWLVMTTRSPSHWSYTS
ncbi:hypothetical protein NEOLEDRAFT_493969 [Neolentinus lepideus HHB14362 ss-1]|uniref:Uncharacterized protein n=1 Tax=Neolentinus lepideus HHB14362 ss-1 TaxID=1314782 RepID=A0A165RMH9_9AGAM|nr:hypothetical protein NEOLEDRAFT_493969 [Neolentinus lepideus HHB14362 ss-1]